MMRSLSPAIYLKLTNLLSRGQSISYDFLKVPSMKTYPDYFALIKKPIALDTIRAKINNAEYDDTDALKADLILMVSNAKKYNEKGSPIYENAIAIQVVLILT
jgi:Bromodomain